VVTAGGNWPRFRRQAQRSLLSKPWWLIAALGVLLPLPGRGADARERLVPVVDLHVDLSYQHNYKAAAFASGTSQFSAQKLLRAGVVGVVLPLFVPWKVSPRGPRLRDFEASYRRVLDAVRVTRPFQEPSCLATPGRVRTFLAFEGAGAFAEQPELLDTWSQRGLRSLGLVHTRHNELASSSTDPEPMSEGLTPAGRDVVRHAQRLGIPIDVSHASDQATREVLALASAAGAPVVATHSNARALLKHPRNLADAEIRSIAASGGVIGVNFHSPFLTGSRAATVNDVVRHIRHLVNTAGIDHVALGSDFDGDIVPPRGLESVASLPGLAKALQAAGISQDGVERIFSRNALRILCPAPPGSASSRTQSGL